MKLRIKDASIRIRLTQGEVNEFARQGVVEAKTPFRGGSTLTYRLQSTGSVDVIGAEMDHGEITVSIPAQQARRWAETDQVGMETYQGPLHILIEKDFQCLHKDAPDRDPDVFPHPLAESVHRD